jgi:hypothetical protein
MEINRLTKEITSKELIDNQIIAKQVINELSEVALNSVGIVGLFNFSIVELNYTPIHVEKKKVLEIKEYKYYITIEVLHTNYNSKFNFEGIDSVELLRVKPLIIG